MSSAATPAASSSMDMAMDTGSCQLSMLWNWTTIDSCFLSSSWRVTSPGAFAGSCLAVLVLVLALELVRRTQRATSSARCCTRDTAQLAGAYIVMLLAMSLNGYIILCIVVGGFLGAALFQRDTYVGGRTPPKVRDECWE
ncbi:uncharacterized protein BXZ73DRAFT_102898 [Epithele typhae]|uniref:uncharacterized protein n=1 Tax=Epithele typhae TaxID=378194 RepID=UPI002007DB74|nr:uncharacterized protein BXZ73DRAFT_102898 [Epithele typhae]KAH9926643.1 hypothetical protein BXZ73DRAFT_102898 [Epithele typhae]